MVLIPTWLLVVLSVLSFIALVDGIIFAACFVSMMGRDKTFIDTDNLE